MIPSVAVADGPMARLKYLTGSWHGGGTFYGPPANPNPMTARYILGYDTATGQYAARVPPPGRSQLRPGVGTR